MRYCGFRLATAGSRANNTPRLIPNPPKCRPIAPKRPIFNCFHPMGLQFGDNTTSNRDLSTSQRGKWRHERRDTPATHRSKASNAANPHRYQHGGRRKTGEPGRATRLGARLRCPRTAAGHGRTTSRRTKPTSTTPSPTGEEGAGGSRGRGRASRRGAAGQHRSGSRTIGPGPGSPAGHQATSTSARPQRTRMNITRARQSRPQTHPTRAQQSSPRAHTPLGHNKTARPQLGPGGSGGSAGI